MTVGIGHYLVSILCCAIAFTPIALGARSLRRRLLPTVDGPPAVLAAIVIALALVVSVSEVLGSVGLFRLVPLVVAFACVGAATWRYARIESRTPVVARVDAPEASVGTPAHAPLKAPVATVLGSWQLLGALGAVAAVFAEWSARVVDSLQRGMSGTADTIWYHMPVAARFAQTGWTPWLHFADGNSLTAFYPANSELVHALGIVLFNRDVLSPLLNLFWLGLALLAVWCIGRPYGVPALSMMGAAALLATPELVLDDAGSALNDVVGIALFLAAAALLINASERDEPESYRGALLCAAVAAGLALGTKYTMIPAVGCLSIAVFVMQRPGTRVRRTALWVGGLALTGSYWYARNLIATGNPLPTLHIGVGPLHLPQVPFPGASKLSDYIFDRHVWSAYLVPGLRQAVGPAWWAVLAFAVAGSAVGVWLGRGAVRLMAAVSFVSFVAFVVSPQILGTPGMPVYFVVNVRYAAPAWILGIAVVPVIAARFERVAIVALLFAFGAIVIATQFDRGLWRNLGTHIAQPTAAAAARPWGIAIGIAIVVVGLSWRLARARVHPSRSALLGVASAGLVALIAGGFFVENSYLSNRYRNSPPLPLIFDRLLPVHDARIAIVGFFTQYPMYGADLSNYVQYVAHRAGDHKSTRITSCVAWRRALNDGHYDYVVATNPGFPFPNKRPALEAGWTRSDPAATLVTSESNGYARAWLFKIDGKLNPGACPRT